MRTLDRIEAYVAIMAKNTLDTSEAALYLGISTEALRNKLPSITHYKGENGRNYFKKSDLDAYRCRYEVLNAEQLAQDAATQAVVNRLTR